MKKDLKPDTILSPVPVVMVSCGDMEDANIISIAWTGIINSEPPLVYISVRPTRHSYNIIKNTGEFVINLPDEKLVWEVDYCGTKSGREIDKFKEAKLTKQQCTLVKAPAIKQCPVSLECKVKEIKHLGSHDMFIAEVIGVNAKEEYILENGKLDLANMGLLTYIGSEYYSANKKIADRGICLKNIKN